MRSNVKQLSRLQLLWRLRLLINYIKPPIVTLHVKGAYPHRARDGRALACCILRRVIGEQSSI